MKTLAQLYLHPTISSQYHSLLRNAADSHSIEHKSANLIQRTWRLHVQKRWQLYKNYSATLFQKLYRGYSSRKTLQTMLMQQIHNKRNNFYHSKATKIQKHWRGYFVRTRILDFYKRKEYIQLLNKNCTEKFNEMQTRETLEKEKEKLDRMSRIEGMLVNIAKNSHHLLGTKTTPGVCSRVKWSMEDAKNASVQGNNESLSLKTILEFPPEDLIKKSADVSKFLNKEKVRKLQTPFYDKETMKQKKSQGPFLPKVVLKQKLDKPLKPTLKVATGFYDTIQAMKREKEKEKQSCISCSPFVVKKVKVKSVFDYKSEPFGGRKGYGVEYFREENVKKRVAPYDFKTILPPIQLFENVESPWN